METNKKLLIADDDPQIRRLFQRIFEGTEYSVVAAEDGEQALAAARREKPDLVVLDVAMPRLDGYKVCGRLRDSVETRGTPILFLSALGDISSKLPGFALGADDYLVKPCDVRELRARVEALVGRSRLYLAASPLTGLPGSPVVEEEVDRRLSAGKPLAMAYADLDFFKSYNDAYGYEEGNSLIRAAAKVLTEAVAALGAPGDLVGHIGGDDFVVVSEPSRIREIAEKAVKEFDAKVPGFYDPADWIRGWIETKNRLGNPQRFPLVSLSIGIVTNERRTLKSHAEAAGLASEMKQYVKSRADGRSRWAADRRSEAKGEAAPARTSVFLFTDLVGSTELFRRLGDRQALELLDLHFKALKSEVEAREGRVIKTMGDALMALFASPEAAVAAALAMQGRARSVFAAAGEGSSIRLKIGLNAGKAVAVEDSRGLDYFGWAVNIAARTREVSTGDDIVMTEALYDEPAVQALLKSSEVHSEALLIELRGASGAEVLWRLRV